MASENNNRSLNVSFGLNASEFSKGVAELKQELSDLNAKFTENKQKITDTSKELKDLHEQQKKLTAEIDKSGEATEEQKEQMRELSEKISQTTAKMGQLKAEEADIKSGIKTTTKELQNQKAALDNNTKSTGLLHKALSKLGTAAKAFIGIYGAKKLWELLIGSNEEMEQYQTSFEVMLGNAEKAKTLITDIQNFAAKTPLTKSDSVSIGSLLMNYGVEADEVIDKMTQLGDLAGGNADKMNRIALAYGQMLAKGKVTGEELRQMTEAGVPLQNALAESIGVTGDEFSKMVSKGQVGIKELDKTIEELTTGNGKFAGMMEKQSQTMQGMLSTLQDNVSEFFRQMGEGAFGEIKDALSDLMAQLKEWEQDGTLERWAEGLGVTVSALIKLLREALELVFEFKDVIAAVMAGVATYKTVEKVIVIVNMLKTSLNAATIAQKAFNAATAANPIGLIAAGIATAAVVILSLAEKYKQASYSAEEFNESVKKINDTYNNSIKSIESETTALSEKVKRYDELRTATNRTNAESAELKSLAEELQKTFGNNVSVVDTLTGKYNDLTVALKEYSEQQVASAVVESRKKQLAEILSLIDELEDKKDNAVSKKYNDYAEWTNNTLGLFDWAAPAFLSGNDDAITEIEREIEEATKKSEEIKQQLAEDTKNFYSIIGKSENNYINNTAKSTENLTEVYDAHKEAVENLAKSLNTVSSAYSEQAENGKLSYNTVMSLIDAGYASCLQIDEETGAVKLNAEAYKELAKAKISARMADLKADIASQTSEYEQNYQSIDKVRSVWKKNQMREFLDAKVSSLTSGSKAELAALQELYDNLDSYITTGGSATGKSGSGYSDAYNAYKTEADKKIELIKKELAAKKELRDKTIAYLDEEIQKRKELNQDDDMQKEIDKIKAQLDYAQLDDFSRGQLEKQLQKAEEERQEVLWQREMQRKKDEANAAYNAASDNAAKAQEQISNAVDTVKSIMDNLANGITNISNIINNNVNNTNNTANINLASQHLTMAQITKAVKDALIGTVLIR